MNLEPIKNKLLFGHNSFFLYLKKLFDKKKLPNKIIFSGEKGIGKCTLSFHLTNYIFSLDEENTYNYQNNNINENNHSYKLVLNKTHPNFFFISNSNEGPVNQISKVRDLINFTNKSSFNNKSKIIVIDNIENMNISSVNALLKLIEEPNYNIYFFLIHNNNKKVINTLKSRCIKFNLFLNNSQKIEVINKVLNNDFYNKLNTDFKNIYNSPGEIVALYSFFKENTINENITIDDLLKLIQEKYFFKKNFYIKNNLPSFVELFFMKKFNMFKSKKKVYDLSKYFSKKLHESKIYNLDIEAIIMEINRKSANE